MSKKISNKSFKIGDTVTFTMPFLKTAKPWVISNIYIDDGFLVIHDKNKQNLVNICIEFQEEISIKKI